MRLDGEKQKNLNEQKEKEYQGRYENLKNEYLGKIADMEA